MRSVTIEGYHIDLDHELFQVKSLKDLKKIDIFSHLEGEAKDKAFDSLWSELHPNAKPPKTVDEPSV
jgi:hypothetical protein